MTKAARLLLIPLLTGCVFAAWALCPAPAAAGPFEARRIPSVATAVGHIDLDALKKTKLYAAIAPGLTTDALMDEMPGALRPLVTDLVGSARGVSFWLEGEEEGAIYLDTTRPKEIAKHLESIAAQGKRKGKRTVAGHVISEYQLDDTRLFVAVVSNTVVFSEEAENAARSVQALAGKGKLLSSKSPLLRASSTKGVFFFAAIGGSLLDQIQKGASSKTMQVDMKSLSVHVGESAGELALNLRAEMGSADSAAKLKNVADGLRALVSLTNEPDIVRLRPVLDRLTFTTRGATLEVSFKMKSTELLDLAKASK